MKRACIYARFSSDNQRTESIDAQIRAIREYCVNNKITVVKIYADKAISGTSTDNREEFLKMIKDSKSDLFDYVIVHKLDRFARNRYDQAIFEKKLNDNNVKIISVLEQFNDSPESVILKSVLTGMSEYFSLNLSREVKKGKNENFENCQHIGGTPPLGLDVDKETKLYIINEEEAEIVRLIFQLALEGNGYGKITDILNKRGFLSKRKKPFGKGGIRDLLRNEKYIGTYIMGKKDRKGKATGTEKRKEDVIPAIIDKNVFFTVQEMLNKKRSIRKSNAKVDYLLTGFMKCACGGKFTGVGYKKGRNQKYNYYGCTNKKRKINDCDSTDIRKEVIEELVFNTIKHEIFREDRIDFFINELKNKINTQNENFEVLSKKNNQAILNIKNKKEKLLGLFLDSHISEEEFKMKNNKLELEMIECIKESEMIRNISVVDVDKIESYVRDLAIDFDNKDVRIKKQMLQTFVDEIIISKDTITIKLKFFGLADSDNGGALERNRTPNPLIRSQMLYPIELRVQHYYHINFSHYFQY